MNVECDSLVADFLQACTLAGVPLTADQIRHDTLTRPHKPSGLPKGWMAVYVFCTATQCLKVGKVGTNSNARFVSQHYMPNSSGSNLAKSLLAFTASSLPADFDLSLLADASKIGDWIKQNTSRVHFFLREDAGRAALFLLEAFVQCRLSPLFEG